MPILTSILLAYHLKILVKSRRNQSQQIAYKKEYKILNTTAQEVRIVEYVRRTTTRKILLFLPDYDRCTSNDIMQHTKTGGSTISWHLSWLRKAGIISARSGMHQTYRLRNKDLVAILMNKSQKSGISC